jgi:hypothetical protein
MSNNTTTKLYVVTIEDIQSNDITSDYAVITTEAPRTNLSGEVRENGWLGTTNNNNRNSHGSYTDMDSARARLRALGYIPLSEVHEDNAYRFERVMRDEEGTDEYWLPADARLRESDVEAWLEDLHHDERNDGETVEQWAARLEAEAAAEGVRIVGNLVAHLEYVIEKAAAAEVESV